MLGNLVFGTFNWVRKNLQRLLPSIEFRVQNVQYHIVPVFQGD